VLLKKGNMKNILVCPVTINISGTSKAYTVKPG
jgi:hypothetical protein